MKVCSVGPFIAALVLMCASCAWADVPSNPSADERPSSVGRKIDNFHLQDFRGKSHSLAEWRDAKAIAVVFLGTECPLSKLYGPRLAQVANEYKARGVEFVAINANSQDALSEMAPFARDHHIEFPFLKDVGNVVADQFGATRNPEVFLLDAERVVRYQGRIDDQYGFDTGIGYAKTKVGRRHLAVAIDELLADKAVSEPNTKAIGCLIGRMREPKADAKVTYSNQIARLFQRRCVECHREGQIGPFSLTEYASAAGWADMIAEVVRERRMPPWHADHEHARFINDSTLSDEEMQVVFDWAAAGAPEGNRSDLPEPRQFHGEWMMPFEPDAIFRIDEEPFDVPAEGTVEYQYFHVPTNFKEDKWIKVAECLPDNRAVVHHMVVFIRPPKEQFNLVTMGHLTGFAPGTRPHVLPPGMAKFVPAGSELVVQMHYTPNGMPQKDNSSIGVKFEDAANVKHKVVTAHALNLGFAIPPNAGDHVVESERTFERDVLLLSMFPHMHLRGKAFKYETILPDGKRETLLNVPHYDFNWQNGYAFEQPLPLPAGTKLHCTAHFDNSDTNPMNPDPTKEVRWGDQTWEEMMIGWFDCAIPVDMDVHEVLPPRKRTLPGLSAASALLPTTSAAPAGN